MRVRESVDDNEYEDKMKWRDLKQSLFYFIFTNFDKHDETYVGMGVGVTKFSVS